MAYTEKELQSAEDADKAALSRLYVRGIITDSERTKATKRALARWDKDADKSGLVRVND